MCPLASARFLACWEDLHAGDDDTGQYVVVMISSKEKCFKRIFFSVSIKLNQGNP